MFNPESLVLVAGRSRNLIGVKEILALTMGEVILGPVLIGCPGALELINEGICRFTYSHHGNPSKHSVIIRHIFETFLVIAFTMSQISNDKVKKMNL